MVYFHGEKVLKTILVPISFPNFKLLHCGGKLIFSLFTLEASLDPNVPIATLILQVAPTV